MGFADELRRAADELARFNREAQRASDGTRRREQEAERTFAQTALSLVGGVGGLARGLTPAAQVFGATGSFDDAANVAAASALEAFNRTSVGGFIGAAAGYGQRATATTDAREQVFAELAPLAMRDVPLSDDFVQRLIDVRISQQERAQALQTRLLSKASYGPVEALDDTLGPQSVNNGLERVADTMEAVKGAIDRLNPFRASGQ